MKRFISNIIFLTIVVLACLLIYKGVLGHFATVKEEINYTAYEKLYYYNQISDTEKELYIKLDMGINNLESRIDLGFIKSNNVKGSIDRALGAIYNDRPEYYFLPNEYNIKTVTILGNTYAYILFDYEVEDEAERKRKDAEIVAAIQDILQSSVTSGMNAAEKELAIHDELMSRVSYYKYQSLDSIPHEKHTAYAALVEKEAVCDGISRAMMLLLETVGIESILAFGDIEDVPHAWNIVKLAGEYYHLDATSNAIDINSQKYVAHNYFNLNDETLFKTHILSDEFTVPKCRGEKYNYYTYHDYEIRYSESMKSKLAKIINSQINNEVLEFRLDELYSTQNLLEALYFLDFNDWHTDGKTSIKYHNINNIYMFKIEIKRRVNY